MKSKTELQQLLNAHSEAIERNPAVATNYANRGSVYVQLGNAASAR